MDPKAGVGIEVSAYCAHMREAGPRAVAATLIRLQDNWWWKAMVANVTGFVKEYLSALPHGQGERISGPYGDALHRASLKDVFHSDLLYVGDSSPMGSGGLPEESDLRYIFVMMDDLNNFVWLEPAASCSTDATARDLLTSCKALGCVICG